MKEISVSEYRSAIELGDCLVVFSKEACPFCNTMKKVMEKFSAENGGVALYDINSEVDASKPLMKQLEIERVPTMLLCKGGAVARRITGVLNPRELTKAWQEARK